MKRLFTLLILAGVLITSFSLAQDKDSNNNVTPQQPAPAVSPAPAANPAPAAPAPANAAPANVSQSAPQITTTAINAVPSNTPPEANPDAPKPTKDQAYKDWRLVCFEITGEKRCSIIQNLVTTQDNKTSSIMTISVGYVKDDGGKYFMNLLVPLGVFLPNGVHLKVATTDIKNIPYLQCARAGCTTEFGLEEKFIESVKSASSGTFGIAVSPAQAIDIPFSLNGFGTALTALKEEAK